MPKITKCLCCSASHKQYLKYVSARAETRQLSAHQIIKHLHRHSFAVLVQLEHLRHLQLVTHSRHHTARQLYKRLLRCVCCGLRILEALPAARTLAAEPTPCAAADLGPGFPRVHQAAAIDANKHILQADSQDKGDSQQGAMPVGCSHRAA